MRPAWQVDTVSTQLKYLEAQKYHLSRLVDQIDTTIHDVKVWINGRINKTVSFKEMCTFIESTLSDVSTKCLEIYREHQYDPVVSEADDETSDYQNLAGAVSGQPYGKRNTAHWKDAFQEDVTECSLKEDGTDDICNQKDESSILNGKHKTKQSQGREADLSKHFFSCKKNPGHTRFVPVNDFNINDLPEDDHDNDLFDYIKATADLSIRVDVKKTSINRPECWRNTNQPYPFYDKRGSDVMRLGTGVVSEVNKRYNNGTCRCHKCQHSDTPSKVWGEVRMSTATHVVFDDLEARHTTCRLFYDRKDSPLVTLVGWRLMEANIEEDKCELRCVTCDVGLLNKLDRMWEHWSDLCEKVTEKYKRSRDEDKLSFIVSHPHGCPKQISVGQWITRYNVNVESGTYPGSSGAFVHSLG